jgi:hypothetical protein
MKLKEIIASLAIAGLSVFSKPTIAGELNGDIGYVHSEEKDRSYVEANVFYGLPARIRGFTFLDFYRGEGGYFGKTILDKSLVKGLNLRGQVVHGNELYTQAGIGVSFDASGMPPKTFANLSLIPFWMSKDGESIENKSVLGYCVGADLPYDFSIKCFGDVNLDSEDGITWEYGELELSRKIGLNGMMGYSAALANDGAGKSTPKLEHRIAIRFKY